MKKIPGQSSTTDYTYTNSGYPKLSGYGIRIDQNNIKIICASTGGLVYLDDATVDIVEQNRISEITVFPNPAGNLINVNAEKLYANEYRIYNYSGNLLKRENINSASLTNFHIDISDFPSGPYILQLSGRDESLYSRFMIMK